MLGDQLHMCPLHVCLNLVHQRKLHHLLHVGTLIMQVLQIGKPRPHLWVFFFDMKFVFPINMCMCACCKHCKLIRYFL